ncbi:MAG: CoA ester lyase [Candidatus Caldarchaeum sp.]|nr:CoA ester lyase [Candidatus Caldarchaeum sp.]
MRRVRRTELVTPAVNVRMMRKALLETAADEVIFDLEDSVPTTQKEIARRNVVEVLSSLVMTENKTIAVRINSMDTNWWLEDLRFVIGRVGEKIDCVVVPKVKKPSDIGAIDDELTSLEVELGLGSKVGIEVIIETAEGLLRCGEIAFSSSRLESLIFGPGDYAADIGMSSLVIGEYVAEYPGHIWHFALFSVRNASAAAGLQAIDGPYALYTDLDGLLKSAKLSRSLGFDGKWVIHPSQISVCNDVYTPTKKDLEKARKIIQAYEKAVGEGLGAFSVEGIMVDGATIRIAKRILEMERYVK